MHQHIYIHAYIHKYIHACNIHTYMHACIHTYVYTYRPWSGVICFAGDAERGEIVRCGLVYYKTFEDYEKAFDLSEEELLKGLWPAVGVCVCVCISLSLSSSFSLPLSLSLSLTHTHGDIICLAVGDRMCLYACLCACNVGDRGIFCGASGVEARRPLRKQ